MELKLNTSKLKKDLISAEGLKLKAYKDTVGKITIGVGRNLDDIGITEEEAFFLLNNDIKRLEGELSSIEDFPGLSEVRQGVIAEMAFNLGLKNLMKFRRMWEAIYHQDWNAASSEMLNSLWAQQVGQRAIRLAARMQTDYDETEVYSL